MWECSEIHSGCIRKGAHSKGRQDSEQEAGMGTRLNHNWEAPMEVLQQIKKSAFLRHQLILVGSRA